MILGIAFVGVVNGSAAAEVDRYGASLLADVPRRAVLVVHTPSLGRLSETMQSVEPLRTLDGPVLGGAADGLDRLDETFVRSRITRLGLSLGELLEAVPGEAMLGWTSRIAGTDAAFQPDAWVFVARVEAGQKSAVRELWRRAVLKAAPGSRIERRRIAGFAVEQAVWHERRAGRIETPRRPRVGKRRFDEPPERIDAPAFGEVVNVEEHAMSFAIGRGLMFFAPSGVERLEPWIRAGGGRRPFAPRAERLRAAMDEAAREGEVILAVHATPPAWVAPEESPRERRLGAHPLRVLLSQTRSFDATLIRRRAGLLFDAQATLLPPPGWAARLVGALGRGATVRAPSGCVAAVAMRVDPAGFWRSLREVLAEGWPAVRVAVDSLLAPLGGTHGEGASGLMAVLGPEVRLFIFERPSGSGGRLPWALTVDVRDAEGFRRFEPRVVQLLQTFAYAPVQYDVAADGRLQQRENQTTAPVAARARSLHMAHGRHHLAVASSRDSLARAIGAVSATSETAPVPHRGVFSVLAASAHAREPALVGFAEVRPGLSLGGQTRRVISGPDGDIELISPPQEEPNLPPSGPAVGEAAQAASAPTPLARLAWAVLVDSEKDVRIRIAIDVPAAPGRAGAPPPPETGRTLRIQE